MVDGPRPVVVRLCVAAIPISRGMVRKLTITVDEDVYEGLRAKVGPRRISRFLNDLAKPLVTEDGLPCDAGAGRHQ